MIVVINNTKMLKLQKACFLNMMVKTLAYKMILNLKCLFKIFDLVSDHLEQ